MGILEAFMLAASLCADCFAVSLCSSVTIRRISWKQVLVVAFSFALIQTFFLAGGYAFGYVFVGLIGRISHIIGFLLLLYVGGEMLFEGIRGEHEVKDLNGLKNIIIGGIATSIDALAVGASQSLSGLGVPGAVLLSTAVFIVTAISVVAGIYGGKAFGCKAGRWAEMVGGSVLLGIGISLLF